MARYQFVWYKITEIPAQRAEDIPYTLNETQFTRMRIKLPSSAIAKSPHIRSRSSRSLWYAVGSKTGAEPLLSPTRLLLLVDLDRPLTMEDAPNKT